MNCFRRKKNYMRKLTDNENLKKCLRYIRQIGTCEEKDKDQFEYVKTFFYSIKSPKERPDGYSVWVDELLILEHFEFDNTKTTRNGSKQQIQYADTEREMSAYLKKSGGVYTAHEYLDKKGKYYVENFTRQFHSHYGKIKVYKENVLKELGIKYHKIYVAFVINDNSCLGSYYKKDDQNIYIDLLYTKEFLDVFEQCPKVDFIFFTMLDNEEHKVASFMSRMTIDEHRKNQIGLSDIGSLSDRGIEVSCIDIPLTENRK